MQCLSLHLSGIYHLVLAERSLIVIEQRIHKHHTNSPSTTVFPETRAASWQHEIDLLAVLCGKEQRPHVNTIFSHRVSSHYYPPLARAWKNCIVIRQCRRKASNRAPHNLHALATIVDSGTSVNTHPSNVIQIGGCPTGQHQQPAPTPPPNYHSAHRNSNYRGSNHSPHPSGRHYDGGPIRARQNSEDTNIRTTNRDEQCPSETTKGNSPRHHTSFLRAPHHRGHRVQQTFRLSIKIRHRDIPGHIRLRALESGIEVSSAGQR